MIQKCLKRAALALAALCLAGCSKAADGDTASETDSGSRSGLPKLGLVTSLPLYWPLDGEFDELAQGRGEKPWQRTLLQQRYELAPLDTLSPIPSLSPDEPETDPLAGLERLAIIQPRGLSSADNVALDNWVRAGGDLLLVLDPVLSGDYDLPLGDPRRPTSSLLVPPVVKRWGLDITFSVYETWEGGIRDVALADGGFVVVHGGELIVVDESAADCKLYAEDVIADCSVGQGTVTLLADAALFEHSELAGENGEYLGLLLDFAFE
ncbi:MAG: hypothetical protein AAFQ27_10405 [Pseudomonadota bacterium]